jgi:hypothetical protein
MNLADLLPELPAGTVQPRPHRSNRHALDLGDLRVGKAFDITKQQHIAELRLQRLDGDGKLLRQLAIDDGVVTRRTARWKRLAVSTARPSTTFWRPKRSI